MLFSKYLSTNGLWGKSPGGRISELLEFREWGGTRSNSNYSEGGKRKQTIHTRSWGRDQPKGMIQKLNPH